MDAIRHHIKRDGVLRIAADGSARYLTLGETLSWFFLSLIQKEVSLEK